MKQKSYVQGLSSTPLLGETISKNLKQTVKKFPNREALVVPYQNYRVTYLEFWKQVTQISKGLVAYGIKKGDRVGIWSPNRFEWVIIQYATARIGAIMVNVNPGYKAQELKYALNQSGISLLIMSKGFRKTNYIDILNKVKSSCIHLKEVLIIDNEWDKLISKGVSIKDEIIDNIEADLEFDEPINIQYTSGTTGLPKGATLTHHNILNNGYFIGRRMQYTENDRVCMPVPLYHCFGMVLGNIACTTHGCCMILTGEAFEPDIVLKTVQDEKATSLYGVPAMFISLLNLPDINSYNLSSLRTGIMAGAQCPVSTMRDVREKMHMKEVEICYGMTETSPVSTQTFLDDNEERRCSTVGKIHPHLEIKIIDPDTGKIVPRNTSGELCTRGYSVMLKYWNNPEATATVIDEARWMHTGDMAEMDEFDYIKIVGRIKDMIIRGGENISPYEIEEYFRTHDKIFDVQVIGVPDKKYGEQVMAWIILKEDQVISETELKDFCKNQIATYKIPYYWKFVTAFPMTVTGKIRKVEMRETSTKELGLSIRK